MWTVHLTAFQSRVWKRKPYRRETRQRLHHPVIKAKVSSDPSRWQLYLCHRLRMAPHLCGLSPQNPKSSLTISKTSDKLKFREILQNTKPAAKSLQSCPTLCNPIDDSPPGSPSLEFSRQEHWSGLPFPSPMHESEKWKWSRSVVSDSWRPHGLRPTRLLHPWDFPGKSAGVGCHCLLQNTKPVCLKTIKVIRNKESQKLSQPRGS